MNESGGSAYSYTKEDFLTPAPYRYLLEMEDDFSRSVETEKLAQYARTVGVRNFKTLWRDYQKAHQASAASGTTDRLLEVTDAGGNRIILESGSWTINSTGVRAPTGDPVCAFPIYPSGIVRDLETGKESYRITYMLPNEDSVSTREITEGPEVLFNAVNIIRLADWGISVVSGKRAQLLATYLRDMVDINREVLPQEVCSNRLGWTRIGTFTPYSDVIRFGESELFTDTFRAFHSCGSYDAWYREVTACMERSPEVRLAVAASFASVLIEPMHTLPFFLHLWSLGSGTGKTVTLMLGASVWGDPSRTGNYVRTFKSTSVGFEVFANFLNSVPMFIDELQLARDKYGKLTFDVYDLSSGTGKTRSNKRLGTNKTMSWSNCFITSGETPMVQESAAAGAMNRVIEIECPEKKKIIADGNHTAAVVSENYGFAGRMFIEGIGPPDGEVMGELRKSYLDFTARLEKDNATAKQASAAALLLTGDLAACRFVFKDQQPLDIRTVARFLKQSDDTEITRRAYIFICGWISRNSTRFLQKDGSQELKRICDIYGEITHNCSGDFAYINKNIWEMICDEGGYSPRALLSALADRELVFRRSDGRTCFVDKKLGGVTTKCVRLLLPEEEPFREPEGPDEPLPF